MPNSSRPSNFPTLAQFELNDRLVVLARTLHAPVSGMEAALTESVTNWKRFGETCLGQALYRHRSFFQTPSTTPAWSHTELSYFRSVVPEAVIMGLVGKKQPGNVQLLRAELLVTTRFVCPAAQLAGYVEQVRVGGLSGIHPSEPSMLRGLPTLHARLLRPCSCENCSIRSVWDVQSHGDCGCAPS